MNALLTLSPDKVWAIAFVILLGLLCIGFLLFVAHKLGILDGTNEDLTPEPFPRTQGSFFRSDFSFWVAWKSGIYRGKKLFITIPYIGNQLIEINKYKAIIKTGSGLYVRNFFLTYLFVFIFLFNIFLFIDKTVIRSNGSMNYCVTYSDPNDHGTKEYIELGESFLFIYISDFCDMRNIIFSMNYLFEGKLSRLDFLLRSTYWFYYLSIVSFSLLAEILLTKPTPPIVFDRKRRIIYTQFNDQLYLSNWDRAFFSVRFNSLAFELYRLDDQGHWQSRWFTLAGHHFFGERNEVLEEAHHAVGSDRSHAMRSWLILYMDKGAHAVHGALPFKGLGDYLMPRKSELDINIEQQIDELLLKRRAPGEAERVVWPDKEVKWLLQRDNTLDFSELLPPKQYARYLYYLDQLAISDTKK